VNSSGPVIPHTGRIEILRRVKLSDRNLKLVRTMQDSGSAQELVVPVRTENWPPNYAATSGQSPLVTGHSGSSPQFLPGFAEIEGISRIQPLLAGVGRVYTA